MKKRLSIALVLILVLASVAFALQQVDNIVEGTAIHTFWTASDGTWQAIAVPSTVMDTRHIMIQVHDGTATSYTHAAAANRVEFQFSSESDGTGWLYSSGLIVSIGKTSGETIMYVKAANGQQIAVACLR